MKKTIFIGLFLIGVLSVQSQQLTLFAPKKETAKYRAINSNRSYATIINGNQNTNKKELIKKIKDFFIEEELATAKNLETLVYDDNLSEFKVRLSFKHGQAKGKGMMGMVYIQPPVTLDFDAVFTFNSSNQLKVTFTNFDSQVIVSTDDNHNINCYKGSNKTQPTLKADKDILNESNFILRTQTGIGRGLIFLNGNAEMLRKIDRGDFRKSLNDQFNVYKNAINNGSSTIITIKNIGKYKHIANRYWGMQVEKFKTEKWVLGVDNYRWENYFEENFNYFMKKIATIISGKIDKVALDGNIMYENVEGKILPKNKKTRRKWLKKDIKF